MLELPTQAPTPGVAQSAVKHPGAPTVPEPEPASMMLLLQRMANELFQAPPGPVAPSSPIDAPPPVVGAPGPNLASPVAAPTAPAGGAPGFTTSEPGASLAVPTASSPFPTASSPFPTASSPFPTASSPVPTASSPFTTAPSLEALLKPLEPLFTVPLMEAPQVPSAPALASTTLPTVSEVQPTSHGYRHSSATLFDPYALKREFPILQQTVNGRPLVWLDNAATTQKPRAVIDRLTRFYEHENSNIHRAAHTLAARATDAFEQARETVRRFLNAPSVKDIIFVRGATEGINLVAQSWGRRNVKAGDEIVVTHLEHHANIVPWQQLCAETGARLKVAPVDDTGQVLLDEYERLLGPRTRLVAVTQVSNALGTITPVHQLVALAHRHGALALVDGAQAVSHLRVDVQTMDCDFYVFSGHKVFAPTGVGAVFARSAIMDETPPWQGGGNMIQDVTFERTTFHPSPMRFEAGTGTIADAVGLGAALDWLSRLGLETVSRYEHELLEYATHRLHEVPGLRLYGTAPDKAGVLSFTLEGQKTEQVGALLDREGIAVRSGHHCAQPILRRFGLEATVRASLAPYNTREDIDALVAALLRLQHGR